MGRSRDWIRRRGARISWTSDLLWAGSDLIRYRGTSTKSRKTRKTRKKQTDLFRVFVGFVFFVVKESPGSQKIKRSGGLLVVQERELGSGARRPRGKTVFLTTHLMGGSRTTLRPSAAPPVPM